MLTQDHYQLLKWMLTRHEAKRNFPYHDSLGNITIGIGYNLSARGLPDTWVNTQFDQDVQYFYNQLMNTFSWYKDLTPDRQIALVDMAFMGWKKFLGFVRMQDALSRHDYVTAAMEMLNSNWAAQVGNRAKELSSIIESGRIEYDNLPQKSGSMDNGD